MNPLPRTVRSLADLEAAARRRLPRTIFDLVAGGAGEESALRRNREGFARLQLVPRVFNPPAAPDLSTTVLGTPASLPLVLAPAGYQRMLHRDAEIATARAARHTGVPLALSTVSSAPFAAVAQAASPAPWFQLYIPAADHDLSATTARLREVRDAGFGTLCITIDTQVAGLRLRDRRNRLTLPFRPTPRIIAHGAVRPRWALDFVRGGVGRGDHGIRDQMLTIDEAGKLLASANLPITSAVLRSLRERWGGKLVVKGVLDPAGARELADLGVDGLVVSNHGGRQLDSAPATIDVLPEVVEAVGGRAEVFLDGGVRSGEDVVKAVALGATACLVGRPYLYGLALGGEDGVAAVVEHFRAEMAMAMTLTGRTDVADLDPSLIRTQPAR